MNKPILYIAILLLSASQVLFAQKDRTDANIVGHVVNEQGEHIPFATLIIKGTTIGTTTDETGHFQMVNMPEGTHTIQAEHLGYRPEQKGINIKSGQTKEIKFTLREDLLNIEQIVVTGDRMGKPRNESSVIVNALKPKLFATTQSPTLSEGLKISH